MNGVDRDNDWGPSLDCDTTFATVRILRRQCYVFRAKFVEREVGCAES